MRILSSFFGIEPHYTDNQGKIHHTDPRTARQILRAKGIRFDDDRIALAFNPQQVLVLTTSNLPTQISAYLPLWEHQSVPAESVGSVVIREAVGRVEERRYCLGSHQVKIVSDNDKGLLRISLPFPDILDIGTYRFQIETSLGPAKYLSDLLCIACPDKCYQQPAFETGVKIAGIAIALYGVKSESNWGVGDFRDLKQIVSWARDHLKADFVGLNPLHALFNKRPFNNSPYLPSSRLFRNFLYLDIPGIEDFAGSPKAQALVGSPEAQSHIKRLRDEHHVNYEEVADLKRSVLVELFHTFLETHFRPRSFSSRWNEFQRYRDSEGSYLERYATFCALHEHFRDELPNAVTWRQWPTAFHDPLSPEVQRFEVEHSEEILFWIYVQWQIDVQLRNVQEHAIQQGMQIGLYHDQALAVDKNGADFWAWQIFFHEGFSIGAPPDGFAPEGQDWGFAPANREQMCNSGFDLFKKNLETNCRHGGALRIDHVMQLNHLFWIPLGKKPSEGVFVKDYENELLSLLCLESQRGRTVIVGEDLGTVPFNFRERLMEKGILSYRLFYFERDNYENQLSYTDYPQCALVSISTHDLPTLAGFWSYRDIELRLEMGMIQEEQASMFKEERTRHKAKIIERLVRDGFLAAQNAHAAWESGLPTDELHTAVLSFILHTPSKLALISQEDLFMDVRQQNFPGTTHEHPNWVTKMRFTVEELGHNPEAIRLAAKFRTLVEQSGRTHE